MKQNGYILFIVAMGLAGAALRGWSIVTGLDAETGLPVAGSFLPTALLTAVTVVLCIVLSRRYRASETVTYEQLMGKLGKSSRFVCMFCGAAMAGVGVIALANLGGMVAEQTSEYHSFGVAALAATIAQWTLCIVSGVLLAQFAHKQDGSAASKRQGIRICVPMFWACLSLIMTYHENSSNPVLADYAYDLLLAIALMAAFYYIAGLFFAEPQPARIALFSGLSVFLVWTCSGGLLVAELLHSSVTLQMLTAPLADRFRAAACCFAGIYLLVQLIDFGVKEAAQEKG